MKKVILYVRVSTDEQAKLGYSLGHQELVLTKFCEIKGFEIVGIYREDFSAKNFERPEYKKLFQYCKSHRKEIDHVLITKWDRFSRNQTDALQEIKKFNGLGREGLSLAEGKLASLEEKFVMNEIEKDSYSFMKPKFKAEIKKFLSKLEELQGTETNHSKYLNFGVNLISEPRLLLPKGKPYKQAETHWFNFP